MSGKGWPLSHLGLWGHIRPTNEGVEKQMKSHIEIEVVSVLKSLQGRGSGSFHKRLI